MHTMGAGCQRDVGTIVDDNPSASPPANHYSRDKIAELAGYQIPLAHLNQINTGGEGFIDLLLERRAFLPERSRARRDGLSIRNEANQRRCKRDHGCVPSAGAAAAVRRDASAAVNSRNPAIAVITPMPVTAPRTYGLNMYVAIHGQACAK